MQVLIAINQYLHICYLLFNFFIFLYIHLFNVIFSHTEKNNKTKQKKQTRRSEQEFYLPGRQETPGPRPGKYNLHLLCCLLSLSHVF